MQELAKEEVDDTANEIQDLADEADLPLEQLMARYGYSSGATAKSEPPDSQADAEFSDNPQQVCEGERDNAEEREDQADLDMLVKENLAENGRAFHSNLKQVTFVYIAFCLSACLLKAFHKSEWAQPWLYINRWKHSPHWETWKVLHVKLDVARIWGALL